MVEITCPHCGDVITDDELRALWGRRNGSKTSEAKRRGAKKASDAAKAKRENRESK